VDLCYYAFHRFAHATNLGWSVHVVQHSSPDFNLSSALRTGTLEHLVSWIFFLPLALIIPPPVYYF
jgi:alkylglycerol monooxygenase